MKYFISALFLLLCSLSFADAIPTYYPDQLTIYWSDISFLGPGFSGTMNPDGQMLACCTGGVFGPTLKLQFAWYDVFGSSSSHEASMNWGGGPTGMFTTGPGPADCGPGIAPGFPPITNLVVTDVNVPVGSTFSVTTPVTFCAAFPFWGAGHYNIASDPDFYVTFNMAGTGTMILNYMGDFPVSDGEQSVPVYQVRGVEYEGRAVPEPATLVLCGLSLTFGALKRLRKKTD